jgi:2-dehydro-3-deoxyphosphogluconate aldolase/(4S)-4-hydroxy-2-oxoglutarate aldolase
MMEHLFMNPIEATSQRIKQAGLVAILRGDFSVDDMLRIGEALLAGSVTVMEVTLNSPSALAALPELRKHFDEKMLVGAGTVRDVTLARQAIRAGAEFLVAPNFDPETVSFSQLKGILHLPGVFTASEAQAAFAAGCRMLKLFPMELGGPAYLKALRAPLNDIDFMATGGVSLENIAEYVRAGAAAVGLGSKLVLDPHQPTDALKARSMALHAAWQEAKAEALQAG